MSHSAVELAKIRARLCKDNHQDNCTSLLCDFARTLLKEQERADKLESVLLSKHGGEPLALLSELDAERERAERWKAAYEHNCSCDSRDECPVSQALAAEKKVQ